MQHFARLMMQLLQNKGGQGTIGSLRRFFSSFLSAVGKKRGRRRQDKAAASQGVHKRQRGQAIPQSATLTAPFRQGGL